MACICITVPVAICSGDKVLLHKNLVTRPHSNLEVLLPSVCNDLSHFVLLLCVRCIAVLLHPGKCNSKCEDQHLTILSPLFAGAPLRQLLKTREQEFDQRFEATFGAFLDQDLPTGCCMPNSSANCCSMSCSIITAAAMVAAALAVTALSATAPAPAPYSTSAFFCAHCGLLFGEGHDGAPA